MSQTLAQLTANNTSGASGYSATSTGNATPRNVSQVSIKNLLYAGATTKVYAHLMGWFWLNSNGSFNSHLNDVDVGYNDGQAGVGYNATQLGAQLDDMKRRGIDGVILDWYGPSTQTTSPNSDGTAAGLAALCSGKGLEFAICIDQGGVSDVASHEGVSQTAAFQICIDYVNSTYYGNAAYMKKAGRPVLVFFPPGDTTIYNWTTLRNELIAQGNPIFVSEGKSAYSIVDGSNNRVCSGAFAWVGNLVDNGANVNDTEGLNYLNDFYNFYQGKGFHLFGSVRKGFNDNLASWGSNRRMDQYNGSTWKDGFTAINNHFGIGTQLENIQIPTWDDYEESTEIETGIASDIAFASISVSGTTLSWAVTGNTAVLDHYEVWGSTDGTNFNLQVSTDTPSPSVFATPSGSTFSLLGLSAGTWTFAVRAVGISCVQNVLSGTVVYSNVLGSPPALGGKTAYPPAPVKADFLHE